MVPKRREGKYYRQSMTIPEIASQPRMVLGVCVKADATIRLRQRLLYLAIGLSRIRSSKSLICSPSKLSFRANP